MFGALQGAVSLFGPGFGDGSSAQSREKVDASFLSGIAQNNCESLMVPECRTAPSSALP